MGGNLVKIAVDTSAVAPMAAWLREKARGNADEARLREILALPLSDRAGALRRGRAACMRPDAGGSGVLFPACRGKGL